jgi:hypothetical protein
MPGDFISGQSDSTACRHCGATLAARLPSCPACGASQDDPPGWYTPAAAAAGAAGSANARLSAPRASLEPQLAAPAAWNTAAGIADDQFYAKHDPWREPNRHGKMWLAAGTLAVLVVAGWSGYLLLRPDVDGSHAVPKAASGTVTSQMTRPAPMMSRHPAIALAPSSVASTPSVAKEGGVARRSEPVPAVPKSVAVAVAPVEPKAPAHTAAPARSVEAMPTMPAMPTTPRPAAAVPKPEAPGLATQNRVDSRAKGPAPAVSRPLASSTPDAQRAAKSNADQTSREVAKNLQIARAMLARDDLSQARSRLAAVTAAQPKNRDAQSLAATLSAREQQRDVVLQAARDCESSGRWICAWHNAGNAMVLDAGSVDAKRILSHAMHEAEAAKTPAAAPVVAPPHSVPDHH